MRQASLAAVIQSTLLPRPRFVRTALRQAALLFGCRAGRAAFSRAALLFRCHARCTTLRKPTLLFGRRASRASFSWSALFSRRQAGLAAIIQSTLLPRPRFVRPALRQAALLFGCRADRAAFSRAALLFRRHARCTALKKPTLLLLGRRTSRSALRWSALLRGRAPHRSRLLRRLLPNGGRARRILPEPAVLGWSKRLRPRHIGGRLNRIVGLANICLPHQILPEVRPTQILRPDFNCVWQQ